MGSNRRLVVRLVAFVVVASLASTLPASRPQALALNLVRTWDLGQRAGSDGQMAIFNKENNGSTFGMPVGGGDLNGPDSDEVVRADVVLAPFNATAGPAGSRPAAGKLRIQFGRAQISGVINPDSQPGVEVWGAREGDFLGNEVFVSDVTGDGLGDVIAGAQNADGFGASNSRPQAGAAYVILGREEWPGTIDLANLNANSQVIEILGATGSAGPGPGGFPAPGDRFGFWVNAGDVDGDQIADLLISADLAENPGGILSAGALYVIPGGANLRDQSGVLRTQIDIANPGQVKVYKIYGIDTNDHLGSTMSAADFDRDGFDDIIVAAGMTRSGAAWAGFGMPSGAPSGGGDGPPSERRDDAGEVYVVYGRSRASWDQAPTTQLTPTPTNNFSIYYGVDVAGYFGEDVYHGDLDGDDVPDLMVGALTVNAPYPNGSRPTRDNAGAGYIFWGRLMSRGEVGDAKALLGTSRMTVMYGEFANDFGADSFRGADLDRDGVDDVLYGSPNNSGAGTAGTVRPNGGDLKVVFGTRTGFPAIIDMGAPPAGVLVHQVAAVDPGDQLTYSFDTADFDGDGYPEMLTNAMGGDGFNNSHPFCGDLYVISGRLFSLAADRGPADAPMLTEFSVAPASGPYYAGQTGIVITLRGDHFEPGATVAVTGLGVLPAAAVTIDSPQRITVRLDDAPLLLARPGLVTFSVINPSGTPSNSLATITLLGPEITSTKVVKKNGAYIVTLKGNNFRPGATAEVHKSNGDPVAVTKTKVKPIKVKATLANTVVRGDTLEIVVVNPGGVLSNPVMVTLP